MGEGDAFRPGRGRSFLTRLSRIGDPILNFIGVTILLTVLVDLIATSIESVVSLPPSWTASMRTAADWLWKNPFLTMLLVIILLLIKVMFRLAKELPLPFSQREVEREYLEMLERDTGSFSQKGLQGLPGSVVGFAARLENIFYPPHFYPKKALTDLPYFVDVHGNKLSPWHGIERVTFSTLWKEQTKDFPAVVILGGAGIGKSTLLSRLTLYMAQERLRTIIYTPKNILIRLSGLLNLPLNNAKKVKYFSLMKIFSCIDSSFIPILLNLNDYAHYLLKNLAEDPEVLDFIKRGKYKGDDEKYAILLETYLKNGRCVIMFDGLDEVDKAIKLKIHEKVINFITKYNAKKNITFNRSFIVSRNPSYDMNTFTQVSNLHLYTMAPLEDEEIQSLLEAYCDAFVESDPAFQKDQKADIEKKKNRQLLNNAIQKDRSLQELLQNPLLLYFLVIIFLREKTGSFSNNRIELYRIVTKFLLENHSISKKLPPIEEAQAINCLGAIAEVMQAQGRLSLSLDEIIPLLRLRLGSRRSQASVEQAKVFLALVNERSGLFGVCCEDGGEKYYGFYARVFQEYFAARYMMESIFRPQSRSVSIQRLIAKGCDPGRNWHGPFVLAVAYFSGEAKGRSIANRILSELLDTYEKLSPNITAQTRSDILDLVDECLREAQASAIDEGLRKRAQQLRAVVRI